MANESLNVKRNFEAEVESALETGQTLTVDWQGVHFDPAAVVDGDPAVTAYITPRSLGYTASPTRKNTRRELWTFQFTINVLVGFDQYKSAINTTHRIWEIIDLIETVFGQLDLAVIDLEGDGSTELFRLRFSEGDPNMLPVGGNEDADTPRWQVAALTYSAFVAT